MISNHHFGFFSVGINFVIVLSLLGVLFKHSCKLNVLESQKERLFNTELSYPDFIYVIENVKFDMGYGLNGYSEFTIILLCYDVNYDTHAFIIHKLVGKQPGDMVKAVYHLHCMFSKTVNLYVVLIMDYICLLLFTVISSHVMTILTVSLVNKLHHALV